MGQVKDFIIRSLCLVATLWGIRMAFGVHGEVRRRQEIRPDLYPRYADLKPVLGIFAGKLVAQYLFRSFFAPIARAMIPHKPRWSHAVWNIKVTRCCDALFTCIYYVVVMIWGFTILRGQPWVPWVLGGRGAVRFCWTDGYPFQPVPPDLRLFYLTAIAHHSSEVAVLLQEGAFRVLPDFWEMLLHHNISFFAVIFSYLLNYVRVGSLVLLLHGNTDIFIYLSKALVDTTSRYLVALSYFSLLLAYAWLRIFIFPVYVMRSSWVDSIREAGAENMYGWGFLNFVLAVLLLLHIYWFGMILKIGFHWRRTGQARDFQANLSMADVTEKKVS